MAVESLFFFSFFLKASSDFSGFYLVTISTCAQIDLSAFYHRL